VTALRIGRSPDRKFRVGVWKGLGATDAQADELVAYAAAPIRDEALPSCEYPLPDASFVAAWEGYAKEASETGAAAVLRRVCVQLSFPIAEGISRTEPYLTATRRGRLPDHIRDRPPFVAPDRLHLFLQPTPAGRVPVILAEARGDFESLVQALTKRNEPIPVPAAQGACMVAGYNNWERVARLRRAWESAHPEDPAAAGWAAAFAELAKDKERYQDRFLILSDGFYSAVPPAELGLQAPDWERRSRGLRLEHECTHFFVRRVFGAMRESMLDELVADYMGILSAFGEFRTRAFLLFMGLEAHPRYRRGGRLENYRGNPPLSDGAFALLRSALVSAAENLGRNDPARRLAPLSIPRKARLITALTRVGLEGLACNDAPAWLDAALAETSLGDLQSSEEAQPHATGRDAR
jgi:hypothetical protein